MLLLSGKLLRKGIRLASRTKLVASKSPTFTCIYLEKSGHLGTPVAADLDGAMRFTALLLVP